jgi:glucosamine--fructose-6-phosphate aminotransferase (isomerizing)
VDGYPVIFIVGPDDIPLIISGINEVTCRGGHTITIAFQDSRLEKNAQQSIRMPEVNLPGRYRSSVMALLCAIPLQILSYHSSLDRGYDPDFPRNLSKTLTVD